jgi:hypothetical protein
MTESIIRDLILTQGIPLSPIKRVTIPTDDGTGRPLGIPDRRGQGSLWMAVKLVIVPTFEAASANIHTDSDRRNRPTMP